MTEETILQIQDVSKRFGGLQALAHATFDLPKGQILGLIGPNGAGKTTLFNCINGVYSPEEGQVIFRGQDITGWKPYRIAHQGLARTHQIVQPLEELTVLENVMAGSCYGHEQRPLDEAEEIADQVLVFVGLAERRDELAGSLNVAQKKRLELARALAARPHLLLLDALIQQQVQEQTIYADDHSDDEEAKQTSDRKLGAPDQLPVLLTAMPSAVSPVCGIVDNPPQCHHALNQHTPACTNADTWDSCP